MGWDGRWVGGWEGGRERGGGVVVVVVVVWCGVVWCGVVWCGGAVEHVWGQEHHIHGFLCSLFLRLGSIVSPARLSSSCGCALLFFFVFLAHPRRTDCGNCAKGACPPRRVITLGGEVLLCILSA